MIRSIIVDDEAHCISRLKALIQEYCKQDIDIIAVCESVEEGLSCVKKLQPELVFLDVQLHDKTGFDLLKQLNKISFDIIFTTAYDKYAVQAFKFSASDYLLKPITPDDLMEAVEKVKTKISREQIAQKIEVLFHNLKNIQGLTKRINVPTVNGLVFFERR